VPRSLKSNDRTRHLPGTVFRAFQTATAKTRSGMKVVAVANQKGGVGKTTTSINLSVCLAELGKRVLLIDLDPQANATSGLGLEQIPDYSVYGPMLLGTPLADVVVPTRFDNLFIVPANLDMAGVEVELVRAGDHLGRLRDALQPLRDDCPFDYVILDCPPSLGILMTNALAAADELLIPLQCEYFAMEGLAKIVGVAEQIREAVEDSKLKVAGILMTMFARTNHAQQVIDEVSKHYSDVVLKTVIPRTIRLAEAPSHGQPIVQYEPSGLGSTAYRALAKEFVHRRQ
jgi:chromosome partitioning protein